MLFGMLSAGEALTTGGKFSLGGITTLLGLGMTFIVLALLIGCVYLINIIVKELSKAIDKLKEKRKAKKEAEQVSVSADEVVTETKNNEIDPETMVAIRSAVEIYLRENGGTDGPHENVNIKSVTKL